MSPSVITETGLDIHRYICSAKCPHRRLSGTPWGRPNYCVNTAIQFYGPDLKPIGRNIRLSQHTWDPQLSALHPSCICSSGTFIGDYFGIDSGGGYTFVSSVSTFNYDGENPSFHQQQIVAKIKTPQ